MGEPINIKNSTARKLKEIPAGRLVIGVNPHKKKHAAVAMPQCDAQGMGTESERTGIEDSLASGSIQQLSLGQSRNRCLPGAIHPELTNISR